MLRALLQKRDRLSNDVRSLLNSPNGENGDLDAEQSAKFDALKAEIENLDQQIQRAQFVEDMDRRTAGEPDDQSTDSEFDRECQQFSISRAIAGAIGSNVDHAREREISAELSRRHGSNFQGVPVPMQVFQRRASRSELVRIEHRALTSTAPAGGPGGNLIGTDHRGDLTIDVLRSRMVTAELGATVIDGLQANVDIPRLKNSAATGWVAENQALTASDPQFDQVQLRPKHCGALVEFSRNVLMQSNPAIDQLLTADMGALLARSIDGAALDGGSANEPEGILSNSEVDTSISMATPSWGSVFDLIDLVEEADSMVNGFAIRPTLKNALRKTPRVSSGDASFIMDSDGSLAGYPALASTQMPAGSIIAGYWPDLLIGYWSVLDVLINPYAAEPYSKGNVQIRAMLTADVALRHPESFAAAIDGPGSA